MFSPDQYELLDFGGGRKLERFGPYGIDRPAPNAEGVEPARHELWNTAAARFELGKQDRGKWNVFGDLPERWSIRHGKLVLELKRTPFGHLGVFPEHAATWDWITQRIKRSSRPLRLLNLFAYTGGSTLAAAAAGADVVHVDAAKNVVTWARRNAELSGLSDAPIRWIAEDAAKFVGRELKRRNRYDGIILDPPTYGHGPRGEVWKLKEQLPTLLKDCIELTGSDPAMLIVTCHTPGVSHQQLEAWLQPLVDQAAGKLDRFELTLKTPHRSKLPSGLGISYARDELD